MSHQPHPNGINNHEQHREFESALELLDHWVQWRTKVHLGLFHEFYMIRFEGHLLEHKPGYFFQPENAAAHIVFFVDPNRPHHITNIGGRTSLTLGEVTSGGNALVLTENVDELVAFAMHLRPSA
jgi:hypothetical protein